MKRELSSALGVALFAAVLGILLNWQGPGLMSDSTSYFKFPRSLQVADLPVHHGVLYALLLGALRVVGLGTIQAAQVLNVVFMALLGYVLASQPRRDAPWIALMTLLSLPLLTCYSTAMSEPVFLLLTAFVLTRLHDVIGQADLRRLALLAVVAGLATVARYSGVALFGVGGLLVLLFWAGRNRWGAAAFWGMIGVIPLLAVMLWNHFRVGSATNRTISWHFIPAESLHLFANTVATWFVPYKLTEWMPALSIVMTLAVLALPILAVWRSRGEPSALRAATVPALYFYGYIGFLAVSICLADISIMPENRMLSPLALCLWPLAFMLRERVASVPARRALGTVLLLVAAMMSLRAAGFTKDAFLNGREYSARAWRDSPAIRLLGALGGQVPLFTNASDADELLHGGHAEALPWEFHATSMLPRPDFTNRFERLRDMLLHSNAVVVRADVRYWPPYLVTEEKILAGVPGLRAIELKDGKVLLKPDHPLLPLVESFAGKP